MVENLNEYWPNLLITFNFTCNEKTLKEIVVVLTDKLETIVGGKPVI